MTFREFCVVATCLALGFSASGQEAVIDALPGAGNPLTVHASRGPDCDGNGTLDLFDFVCFENLFNAADPGADYDRSGALDVFDFLCFHNAFAAGTQSPAAAPADLPAADNPAPGQWCHTQEHYIAGLIDQGINPLAVVCAAEGPCDNPADRNASIPDANTPIKTYRLSIHVFCDDGGSNCAVTQFDVDGCVAWLNAMYAPWRIQFIYQTNFINSTKYLTLSYNEESGMKRAYADSPSTKLNIYVVDTPGLANWGTFPWDPIALGVQGGIVADLNYFGAGTRSRIIAHEVGHCLGLWHTHHGVSEVPQCGDCYESAGRSPADGDIAGDRCSDTNPTPTNAGLCSDAPGADPCSNVPWAPTPYTNYMGYAPFQCVTEFTPQQAGRMHCWTEDALTGWLDLPSPPAAPGTPALTKIGGGVVRATWADNSGNEDGFRVQRETKSGPNWINTQIVATVGANTATATDAPGSGTFRYRVQAFNGIGDSAWSGWTQIKN